MLRHDESAAKNRQKSHRADQQQRRRELESAFDRRRSISWFVPSSRALPPGLIWSLLQRVRTSARRFRPTAPAPP
jgi:hypothetical protein